MFTPGPIFCGQRARSQNVNEVVTSQGHGHQLLRSGYLLKENIEKKR